MKQFRIILTEQQWIDLQNLIGEIPTKFGNPLVNILIPNAQEAMLEDDGGSPKPPKPPKPSEE